MWVARLARRLRSRPEVAPLMPNATLALLFLAGLLGRRVLFWRRGLTRSKLPFLKPRRVFVQAALETIDNAVVDDKQFVTHTS